MSGWINFKELRSKLDFETVLKHYGVEVKRKGDQHHGYCPLPAHQGVRNSPSFSANLTRGIFRCFGCGAKGNILEFAVLMEKADPEDGAALRKVALGLAERFCKGMVRQLPQHPEKQKPAHPVIVNAPLDFALKGLDLMHPYLYGRGFTKETIEHFGLGFCSRGMLKDRIVVPLHDARGRLIGYAGRVVDDDTITENNPRYRFPGTREREGKTYDFRKTRFLYNGFRIAEPVDDLIVVEGFASVWWLHQNGKPNVVATMGADCSERQAELIMSLAKLNGRVWCVPDGDEAGKRFVESVLIQISPYRFVRSVKVNEGRQPTDMAADELKLLISK